MKFKKFQFFKKKWLVNIRISEKILWIEITDAVVNPEIFRRIIYEMYKDYDAILLSQFIDTQQWHIGNRSEFVEKLKQKYSAEIFLTKSYTDSSSVTDDDSTLVLNTAGLLNRNFLSDVIGFGMTNLPNIIYRLGPIPNNWSSELSERWNGLIVKWFDLNIDETNAELINLVEQTGPIELTIDGHVNFIFTRIDHLHKLLKILRAIAKENDFLLSLIILDPN
jgi:hypothetical protein